VSRGRIPQNRFHLDHATAFLRAHRFFCAAAIFFLVAAENGLRLGFAEPAAESVTVAGTVLVEEAVSHFGGLPLRFTPLPLASRVSTTIASFSRSRSCRRS
jgi:hypothetical protein